MSQREAQAQGIVKDGTWFKLEVGNDWGCVYYARKSLNEHGMASATRAYKLAHGETVHVRLKSGEIREGILIATRETQHISDHGHSHAVTSTRLSVAFEDGLQAPIETVELQYAAHRDPTAVRT